MKDHYINLFQFNQWANTLVVGCLAENALTDEKIIGLMCHIVLAQENWLGRVKGTQNDVPVWQLFHLDELKSRSAVSDQLWLEFMNALPETELNVTRFYRNMAGEPQHNSLEDILTHVANHGTYHRGQIVLLLREKGITPPSTDFIKYKRIVE